MTETQRSTPPPISHGTVINDRYEIRQSLGKGGMGEVFLAYDRSTQQPVALKIVREEARMPGDDEALRQELLLARSVSHPNVCRVHDLAPSPYGPNAPHAHPAEEGPGRLYVRRVPAPLARDRVGRRGDPRARPRPRRPEAR